MVKTGILLYLLLLAIVVTATFGLAGAADLSVSATILSKNQCKFKNPSSQMLSFGDLDPLNAVDVTRQATLQFVCNGNSPSVAYFVSDDDGQHAAAPDANRMQNLADPGAYLPYSFAVSPAGGTGTKGANVSLTVVGTIRSTDYQLAIAGTYSDQIVITVQP